MGWKNLPYWIKGGIIGLILFLILLMASLLNSTVGSFFALPMILVCLGNLSCLENMLPILGYILLAVLYFLIGNLIGWIIGRIRLKNP